MDEKLRELPCRRVQVDEIWSYVGKKQRQLKPEDDRTRVGDQWTFVAIDEQTKLVPSYCKRCFDPTLSSSTEVTKHVAREFGIVCHIWSTLVTPRGAFVDSCSRA